jgi:hypothetical protein
VISNASPPKPKEKENKSEKLTIDLALLDPNTVFSVTKNCQYSYLEIKNAIPQFAYNIKIVEEYKLPEPLSLLSKHISGGKGSSPDDIPPECEKLNQAYLELDNFCYNFSKLDSLKKNEKELGRLINSLEKELAEVKHSNRDTSVCPQLYNKVKNLLNKLYRAPLPVDINVSEGKKVKVIISRGDISWTYEINGREGGKWLFTYGFGFTSSYLESPTYFSQKESDSSNSYIITTKTQPSVLDLYYIPAIFYSYFPFKDLSKNWNISLTAGLDSI